MSQVPTLPPPDKQDLIEAADKLENVSIAGSEGDLKVAQFLRMLAPQIEMFSQIMPS